MLVTNEYPLDVSLPCECIYVLVERCFPELQSHVYLSEWVRKGQLEQEGLAEEGKLEPGSKRQQVTGVTVSLAPTLCSVGFQNRAPCFPFLLALSKFSCTIPIQKLAQGYFFAFVEEDEELVSCFQQICFPFFFQTLKFCFQRAGKMETEIIDSTTTSRPKMPSLLLTREYHISQVDTFYTLEKKNKNTIFSSLLINCPLGYQDPQITVTDDLRISR